MQLLFLTNLLAGKAIQAFCWMLIHSLWQGLFFTVITGVVMVLTTKSGAVVRYNIVSGLFFAFISVCCFTFIRELNYTVGQVPILPGINTPGRSEHGLQYILKGFTNYSSSHASLIVMMWFIVFCFKGVQLTTALAYNQRLKSNKILPPTLWKNKIATMCEQLRLKKTVLLFQSHKVKVPVVIGHLKPIIFIPVGLLTSLPAGEVEAILLHELAHIRRNDYVVNMIQVITENIFFFNPALLWMSNVLREERENCCDDVAVTHSKSKKQYIQALVSFKEHALYTTSYTIAFPASRNQLLKRVSRIVYSRNNSLDRSGKMFFFVSFLFLTMLSIVTIHWNTTIPAAKKIKEEAPVINIIQPVPALFADIKRTTEPLKLRSVAKKTVNRVRTLLINTNASANLNIDIREAVTKQDAAFDVDNKALIAENKVTSLSIAARMKEPEDVGLAYKQQVQLYRQQAEKDREQAAKDRKQAELDRLQADKDREQAIKDRKQAEADRQQAEKDREQAQKDRLQAEKERM